MSKHIDETKTKLADTIKDISIGDMHTILQEELCDIDNDDVSYVLTCLHDFVLKHKSKPSLEEEWKKKYGPYVLTHKTKEVPA